jgi:hypothetical protein
MTLAFAGLLDRTLVISAVDRVAELVSRPQIAHYWDEESSCEGMTVGGLARHLIAQAEHVVTLLSPGAPTRPDAETLGISGHYARSAWAHSDLDDPVNTSMRDRANAQGATGYGAAAAALADARSRLPETLAGAPEFAFLAWQGWSLATDDFLVTRLMEIVVHSDDLAVSVGLPTPAFGADVLDPVLRLLSTLSVQRHGEVALVRTLTRPQRASRDVTAF